MPITITYLGTLTGTTDGSSFSLGNVSPSADGLLVVVTGGRRTADANLVISSVSIGGTNGFQCTATAAGNSPSAIYAREVAAGTRAISVTWNTTAIHCWASCYLIEGYHSKYPYYTYQARRTSSGSVNTIPLEFPENGGAVYGNLHATDQTAEWSNATEHYDQNLEAGARWSSASKTASGSNTETITLAGSATTGSMIGAVWQPSGNGPWTILATSAQKNPSGNSVASCTINSTGANLIVALASTNGGITSVTDNQGNTWTAGTLYDGIFEVRFYYCIDPTTSASHTITVNGSYPACSVLAASATGTISFEAQNGNLSGGSTIATGSITPTVDDCLVLIGISANAVPTNLNRGFKLFSIDSAGSESVTGGIGYLNQDYALAINPTWTMSGSTSAANIIAFKVTADGTTLTPDPVSAKVSSLNTSVILGSITRTPAASASKSSTVNPSALQGSLTLSPNTFVRAASVNPFVPGGGVTLTPAAIAALAATVNPSLTLGSLTLSPVTSGRSASVNPATILGSLSLSPSTFARVASINPSILGSGITLTPSPSAFRSASVNPFTRLGSILLNPGLSSARSASVNPSTSLGAINLSPIAFVRAASINPTILGSGVTITPSPSAAVLLTLNPSIVLSSLAFAPTPIESRIGTTNPFTVLGSISLVPAAIFARTYTPPYGDVFTPDPISARASTINPIIVIPHPEPGEGYYRSPYYSYVYYTYPYFGQDMPTPFEAYGITLRKMIAQLISDGIANDQFVRNDFTVIETYLPLIKLHELVKNSPNGRVYVGNMPNDQENVSRRNTAKMEVGILLGFQHGKLDIEDITTLDEYVSLVEQLEFVCRGFQPEYYSWSRTECMKDENGVPYAYNNIANQGVFEAYFVLYYNLIVV